ncbi:hypothetical protein SNE40_000635 [Patella caerulea]
MTVSSIKSKENDEHKASRNEPPRDPKCNSKKQKTYTAHQNEKAREQCCGVNERVLPKRLSREKIQTVDHQLQSNKEDTYLTYQNEDIDCGTTSNHQNEVLREGVPGNVPSNKEDTYKVCENSELNNISDSDLSNEETIKHPYYFFWDISESILPTPPKINATDSPKNRKDNQTASINEYQKVSVVNESNKETLVGPSTNSTKKYTQTRVFPRFHCVPCTNGEYIRFVEKTAQGSTGLDFELLIGDPAAVAKGGDSVSLKRDMFINVNQILTESNIPSLDEIRNQTGLSYDDVHELIHSRSNIRCSLCRRQNS